MKWIAMLTLIFSPLLAQIDAGEDSQLYLSLNVEEGAKLELSDGSVYEIDPKDRLYTSYWITPIPLMLGESGDEDFPVKITNLNNGRSVNGVKISVKALFEKKPQQTIPDQEPSVKPKQSVPMPQTPEESKQVKPKKSVKPINPLHPKQDHINQ